MQKNTLLPESRTLAKSFEPQSFEQNLYQFWNDSGCFHSSDENAPGQKSFCMVIPPPNVTGVLHMGHALTNTIQDILARWHRMCGDNTLWLPGTDHAGIATQTQVEKALAKEGKNRHQLGRAAFIARTWQWKEEHGSQICNQLKRLGSSLDWRRERFTMDDGLSDAVREVFVRLYEEGLIYRGERIINWCPRCQTALSDLEVVPTDRKGYFWHITYWVCKADGSAVLKEDGTPEKIIIATTRPETLLGDTAVAIHPEDERTAHLKNGFVRLPLMNRVIPIIVDEYVDRAFGTGALKITPAHDFNDYELGKKHNLATIQVMGKDGKMTAAAGEYAGLSFTEARERVVADLKEKNLWVKTEDHAHKVGLCQRCDTIAEPVISKQWFVKIEPLARPAIEAVETGRITFTPKNWEKTYFEWMYNIRDWCISRQLWWGHQIPAWYCNRCQGITVARSTPDKCTHCAATGAELRQDEDVLDTWFSSALWPFSTLGWPDKTKALQTFYPTSILETGFDIIFFWVARMVMMGLHFMDGQVPFEKIYLHAMVRDEKGEKMSKSKGNVIDPLVVIDQHGADPLRFTLAIMAGQGRDVKLSLDRVEGYRAFCNKLWNAVKFYHFQCEADRGGAVTLPTEGLEAWLQAHQKSLAVEHRWILSRLAALSGAVENGLKNFELNGSAQSIYDFTWYELCDWYIEFSKLSLKEVGAKRTETLFVLRYVLETLLRLAHPFIPFVTEELWQSFADKQAANTPAREKAGEAPVMTLMLQKYPIPEKLMHDFNDDAAVVSVQRLRAVIEAIRNFRGENNLSPKVELHVVYIAHSKEVAQFVQNSVHELEALSKMVLREATAGTAVAASEAVILVSSLALELRLNLKGLVNVEEESRRLNKELERTRDDLKHVQGKLTRESFIAKAPAELVEKEKAKETELLAKIQELQQAVVRLASLA